MEKKAEKHFLERAEESWKKERPIDTDFLSPDEYQAFLSVFSQLSYASPKVYKEDWERKLIHFGPGAPQISILKITSLSYPFVKLSHPDYLGALLGLGLERKVLGDVLAFEDKAYVYVKKSFSDFICQNLISVGRAKVIAEEIPDLPEDALPKFSPETIIVSSLRLDRILSTTFRLSRSKAQKAIEEGLVLLDGSPATRPDFLLSEGIRISFRHHGKIRLRKFSGRSKKGSYILEIDRYE